MKKILIIEDEPSVREEIARLLQQNNYEPILLADFIDTLQRIRDTRPDLILLDINIPHLNGQKLLQDLRAESNVPVIMVTSLSSEIDEALAISYGADDFISKPFNPNILLLRIAAVLRRSDPDFPKNTPTHYRDLRFDLLQGTLASGDQTLTLTKTELIIFSHLLAHQNQIITRTELMTLLWDNANYLNDSTLTVNISRLRDKLEKLGTSDAIITRKGMGYILQ